MFFMFVREELKKYFINDISNIILNYYSISYYQNIIVSLHSCLMNEIICFDSFENRKERGLSIKCISLRCKNSIFMTDKREQNDLKMIKNGKWFYTENNINTPLYKFKKQYGKKSNKIRCLKFRQLKSKK